MRVRSVWPWRPGSRAGRRRRARRPVESGRSWSATESWTSLHHPHGTEDHDDASEHRQGIRTHEAVLNSADPRRGTADQSSQTADSPVNTLVAVSYTHLRAHETDS